MNDVPSNIELFNVVTLRVLDRLYGSFPVPIEITPGTIGIEITAKDDSDTAWKAMEVAEHTLRWLEAEGFVKYGNKTFDGKFKDVQLTLRGLAVLGSVPASIQGGEPSEPFHKKIKRVLASGAESAVAESAQSLLQEMFKAVLSGLGS